MNAALRHQQEGRPRDAEAICRRVLKAVPGHPDVLHYLGLALHQQGRSAEGLRGMREALAKMPANPVFHNNLGFVLKSLGRFDEAEARHREAIRLQPGFADAWYNLGVLLQERREYTEAETAYRKAVELRPEHAKSWINLAQTLQKRNRLADCVRACEAALLFQPDLIEAAEMIAGILAERGECEQAESRLRDALRLHPDSARLKVALAAVLRDDNRLDEAGLMLAEIEASNHGEPDVHAGLGGVLQTLGEHARSVEHFERALGINPDHAGAMAGLAHSRKFGAEDSAFVTRLEQALADNAGDDLKTASLHFALGKIHDDRREYDPAFAHYRAGNVIKHRRLDFDRAGHRARVDALIEVFTREFIDATAAAGPPTELPVFVIGMPRSGTTLTEQILASHPNVLGAGELSWLGKAIPLLAHDGSEYPQCLRSIDPDRLHAAAEYYLARLPSTAPGQLRVTDKLPGNFMHAGLIALLLPRARIIHCSRDPLDTCLSIYFQNFSAPHPYAYDLDDLGFYYRQYERLMAHWRAVLGARMIEVGYEETVENLDAVARRLIDFCGLPWDDRCLAFHETDRIVKTASQWQVRQPIYRSSKQRWRNYEKHLGPLIAALENSAATPAKVGVQS